MFFISSIFPIHSLFILYIALRFLAIVYEKNQPELAHFILVKLVDYILALTTTENVILYKGVKYNIVSVDVHDGYKRDLTLYCKRSNDGGLLCPPLFF